MQCAYCSTLLPAPHGTARCARCGAVHHDDGTVISPRMLPAYEDCGHVPGFYKARLSPWMLPGTRPLVVGFYDVRYSDGTECRLRWNGLRFTTWDGRVVKGIVSTWRGSWDDTR